MSNLDFFSWAKTLEEVIKQNSEESFPTVYRQTFKTLEELRVKQGYRWKEGEIVKA